MTTIPSSSAIAIEIGKTRWSADSDTPTSTAIAASVAYATDEIGSDEKIGSASVFDRSVSSSSPVDRGRPISTRLVRATNGFLNGGCATRSELTALAVL